MQRMIIPFFLIFTLVFAPATLWADQRGIKRNTQDIRLALVIGNGAYKNSPLKNPVNDARDMTDALQKLGFKVMHHENSGLRGMEDAVRAFGKRLKKGGVGLFYFSGHGIQAEGRNYLLPTDAAIEQATDLKYEAMDAGRVLDAMYNASNRLNIVVLDACRNNPFARSFRDATKGLARMDAPTGTIIAYATGPGNVAADGDDRNGVYTKHLLRHIRTPGLKVEDVFKKVRVGVLDETDRRQAPWESSSLTGDFCFIGTNTLSTQEQPKPTPIQPAPPRVRLRSQPAILSDDVVKAIIKRYSFFDKYQNKSGNFKNDFKDNGNGTVTDRATGLMWQQSGANYDMKYEKIGDYIHQLNRKGLGGYKDWRLPTFEELASLLENRKWNKDQYMYIDPVFDGNQGFCWSSDMSCTLDACYVSFFEGSVVHYYLNDAFDLSVRLVRSGQLQEPSIPKYTTSTQPHVRLRSQPSTLSPDDTKTMLKRYNFFDIEQNESGNFENDFKDNGNGTVTDCITGLMWQQSGSCTSMRYESIDYYIRKLNRKNFGGYSDWRLPTIDELASLLEKYPTNSQHIDPIFDKKQSRCWSSDSGGLGYRVKWFANFENSLGGGVSYSDGTNDNYLRLVRVGQ